MFGPMQKKGRGKEQASEYEEATPHPATPHTASFVSFPLIPGGSQTVGKEMESVVAALAVLRVGA